VWKKVAAERDLERLETKDKLKGNIHLQNDIPKYRPSAG